jgi:acetyl esterase/lipase
MLALLVLPVAAPCAEANVPAPVTTTNTVRFTALDHGDGTLTTTVAYTDADATATASTGNTIRLERGFSFRLRTCVAYHLNARTPVSSCAERDVDTRSGSGTVTTFAPSVTLAGQPRPTTGPWGYFSSYTEVLSLSGGSWLIRAQSWPDTGLQGAGIPVAPQGQDSGTLPPNSTVTLDGAFNSAINSGQPDSICTNIPAGPDGSALPAGVDADHPAFAGAPGYYEVGAPTGTFAGQPPLGVMLVIHGGGWDITGFGGVVAMRPDADRWRARGWETVNLTYRACGNSAGDVLWFFDRTRAWFGAGTRICALGTSAGGHLALLVGTYRPDLYCAISQAGPTDLRTIQSEVAYDAESGTHSQTLGGRWVHNLAAAAFGEENLPWLSPAALAYGGLKSTRVLQGFSADDAIVPYGQAADLADAMHVADLAAYVDNVQLATGAIPFAHGRVSRAALDDFYAREARLASATAPPAFALSSPSAYAWRTGAATTFTPTSRSCSSSTGAGAPVSGSAPLAVSGNAMTAQIESRPASGATTRPVPDAIPPCGGAP